MPKNKRGKKGREKREKEKLRIQQEQKEKAAEEEHIKQMRDNLLLKKGTRVVTKPSSRFPEAAHLTVSSIQFNKDRNDWMITFLENDKTIIAWYANLGRTYFIEE